MTSFITIKGKFKTDLEPDFIKNNQDLIRRIFKKSNFAFNDFNFYQNTINCDIQTPDIYLPSILPELFTPNKHQADFTRLLHNMRESNTRIHLTVQSLNMILPEYLNQDVDLISNSYLELKAVNIHTYTDLDTEYDLINNNYAQGISLRDSHDLKENRMILLTKIAKPISQLQSVQKLGLTPDEIIKRIVKYVKKPRNATCAKCGHSLSPLKTTMPLLRQSLKHALRIEYSSSITAFCFGIHNKVNHIYIF